MKEHFCSAEKSIITYQGECSWCGESEGGMAEIIDMARQASRSSESLLLGCGIDDLKAFAKLVAEAEREACLVDVRMNIPRSGGSTREYQMAMRVIARIEARGKA